MNLDPFGDPGKTGISSFDIFKKFKRGGGGHRTAPKPAAPEPESEPDPTESPDEEVQEKPKDKVVLRNPKWDCESVGFNEETDISVEAELPEAHAHKTRVNFELFAKTPDGPESISKCQGNIKDGHGVLGPNGKAVGKAQGRIPVYIPQYKDEDGNLLARVEYYFTAKHSQSDLLKDENAVKVVDEMADRLIESHILQDVTFATDKSFLSPRNAPALKRMMGRIKEWREKFPEGKLAVFGHTDAMGKEDYNKKLSERRAESVHAFLAKDPAVWNRLYDEEKWGLAATQELLKHLGHDPGPVDGVDGPKTQAAMKAFQDKQGLSAGGMADAVTRETLYRAFMEDCNPETIKAKDFDVIDGKPFTGCSEFNLAEKIDGSSEPNRRVAVLLLKSNKNFPIQYPCQQGDIGPCRKQKDRKGERRTAGFGCLFYDKLVREEKGGGTAPVKLGPFKFKDIEAAEIKQYVNLPTGTVGQGMERLIEVEVEGAPDGAEVFWKITAGEKNSKRNDPRTGAKVTDKDPLLEFKDLVAEASSKTVGAKASLVICCGAAGGDTFTVEAGPARDKLEAKLVITNWRKLVYEILAPDFMPFEERALPDGAKVMDFAAGMRDRIKDRLGKAFVEYEVYKSHIFPEVDAPECSVFKSEQMGFPAGKKAYVLTDHTFKSYPRKFDKGMAPRSIGLKLCNRNYFFVKGDSQLVSKNYLLKSNKFEVRVEDWYSAYFLPKSAMDGADAVKSFKWTAMVDPAIHPKHPGVANGKARTGKLESSTIVLITASIFEIELPSTLPDDPGAFAGPDVTETHCPIEIEIDFEAADAGLGLAGQGAQNGENLVVYNADAPDSFVDVLLHELGHSMGQTVYKDINDPPSGLEIPKTTGQADTDYAHHGTKGHTYVGKGHSGSHCAYGVSDADKATAKYGGKGGTCIMFGENSGLDPSSATTGFCPLCQDYIKARNLFDLESLD